MEPSTSKAYLRSVSNPDVKCGQIAGSKERSTFNISDVNAQPQDFLIVDGQVVRTMRSPRLELNAESTDDVNELKDALKHAREVISLQTRELQTKSTAISSLEATNVKLRKQISELHEKLQNEFTSGKITNGIADCERKHSIGSGEEMWYNPDAAVETPKNSSSAHHCFPSGKSTGTRSINSININGCSGTSPNSMGDDVSPTSLSSSELLMAQADQFYDTNKQTRVPVDTTGTTTTAGAPVNLQTRLSMGSQERRRLAGTTAASRRLKTLPRATPSPSVTPTNNNTTDSDTPQRVFFDADSPVRRSPFQWNNESRAGVASEEAALYLFVCHDNPQLGATVASQLLHSHSHSEAMRLMLECKCDSPGNTTVFVIGSMVYSGNYCDIQGHNADNIRGSGCLVCSDLWTMSGDINSFPTRSKGEILEINLLGGVTGAVRVTTKSQLHDLFRTCSSRVDVILDPTTTSSYAVLSTPAVIMRSASSRSSLSLAKSQVEHSGDDKYLWFPYWEGKRKMAPQFRSKGIGYLRLGDDMSKFGTAFLSSDAGQSYMDNGQSSATTTTVTNSSSTESIHNNNTEQPSAHYTFRNQHRGDDSENINSNSNGTVGNSAMMVISPAQHLRDCASLREACMLLKEEYSNSAVHSTGTDSSNSPSVIVSTPGAMKWAEKVASLDSLHNCIDKVRVGHIQNIHTFTKSSISQHSSTNGSISATTSILDECMGVLCDTMTKQKNPLVLKGAIRCVGPVVALSRVLHCASAATGSGSGSNTGAAALFTATNSLMWKRMLLDLINMLRGSLAAVCEEARVYLLMLHSQSCLDRSSSGVFVAPCFSISLQALTPLLDDIFTGPKGSKTSSAANTGKVVGWISEIAAIELKAAVARQRSHYNDSALHKLEMYEQCNTVMLLQRSRHLLQHKEELTRDKATTLLGSIFLLDIAHTAGSSSSSSQLSWCGLLDDLCKCALRKTGTSVPEILSLHVKPECISVLNEIKSSSARIFERVVDSITDQLKDLGIQRSQEKQQQPQQQQGTLVKKVSSALSLREKTRSASTGSASDRQGEDQGQGTGGRLAACDLSGINGDSDDALCGDSGGDCAVTPDDWFNARLLLRVAPLSDAAWSQLVQVVEKSPIFFQQLTHVAAQHGLSRGCLLRKVLPFDEGTCSANQANIAANSSKFDDSSIDRQTMIMLQTNAVELRNLIRVKMADEADFLQAVQAVTVLTKFCGDVQAHAHTINKSPSSVIRQLAK